MCPRPRCESGTRSRRRGSTRSLGEAVELVGSEPPGRPPYLFEGARKSRVVGVERVVGGVEAIDGAALEVPILDACDLEGTLDEGRIAGHAVGGLPPQGSVRRGG